nr:uncharacterized protein LOC128686232 [Cherax quadricarinatus]
MISNGNFKSCSSNVDILNVSLPVCRSRTNTHFPNALIASSGTLGDHLKGRDVSCRHSNNDGSPNRRSTRNKYNSVAFGRNGDTDDDDFVSRKEAESNNAITANDSAVDCDLNTNTNASYDYQKSTDAVNGCQHNEERVADDTYMTTRRPEVGNANTTRKKRTADGYNETEDSSGGCPDRNETGGGDSCVEGGREDEETTRDQVREFKVLLRELTEEVESGLTAVSQGTHYSWNKCYNIIKAVKWSLREAARDEEDLCLTFLKEVLTLLLTACPGLHNILAPTDWWLALEAVSSAVMVVSTWSPLLLRAGNLLLQALLGICDRINNWISGGGQVGGEHLAEVAYWLAASMSKVVTTACIFPQEPEAAYSTTTTKLASETFTLSDEPSIEAALEALSPGVDAVYTSMSSWANSTEGMLYFMPPATVPQARDTTWEENRSRGRMIPSDIFTGFAPPARETAWGIGREKSREDTEGDVVLLHGRADEGRPITYAVGEIAKEDSITAALDALAPYSRRKITTNPLLKKQRTNICKDRCTNTSSGPPELAEVEWNLLYWRSVLREKCEPFTDLLPMFGLQITEIVHIIDRCCG